MKTFNRIILLLTLVFGVLAGVAYFKSQSGNLPPQAPKENLPTPEKKPAPRALATNANEFIVLDDQGQTVATITLGEMNAIHWVHNGKTEAFQGRTKDKDKRKYVTSTGSVAFEIKAKEDAFKLRDPNGQLLWKVKLKDEGKVKISDNEENRNPIVLKPHKNSISIEEDGKSLGQIRWDANHEKALISNLRGEVKYSVVTSRLQPAFGIFLVSSIPASEAAVLMAELLNRDR